MPRIQQIDDNGRTIYSNEGCFVKAPWTFLTATTGATGVHTVFTVTGDVALTIVAVCETSLAGAGTIELGVVGNTAAILSQIADATTFDANDVWTDDGDSLGVGYVNSTTLIVANGLDIIMTIGTTAITSGKVNFYCLWRPLSSTSSVVATTPA